MHETYRLIGREHERELLRRATRRERRTSATRLVSGNRAAVAVLVGILFLIALGVAGPGLAANDVNVRFPTVEVGSPCTSEPVLMEAVVHIVVAESEAYFRFHANEIGSGRASDGTLYVGNNTFRSSFQNRGPTVAFTEVFHLNVIRQAEGLEQDDFKIHGVVHVTVTPSGVRAEVDELRVTCS